VPSATEKRVERSGLWGGCWNIFCVKVLDTFFTTHYVAELYTMKETDILARGEE
jgi:hypothetical protein